MSTEYLFSGADVSGRDELFATSERPDGVFTPPPIARATTTVAFALAVAMAFTTAGVFIDTAQLVDIPIQIGFGSVADQIRLAASDRTQPNDTARDLALDVLERMRALGISADRAVGDPDGGIALYVFGGRRTKLGHPKYGRVVMTNEGDVVAMCVDHIAKKQRVWDASSDVDSALTSIRAFVRT